ncbi:MAG: putative DsbA family dithiol-disulfide isomerase [Halieaceae bacterium]|jgi:predicted DsbA family dithiol-disulfide isomerase
MTESSKAMSLKVDIVSDVVCPWCIIGYKQLQKALVQMPDQFDVSLAWHPFELNPQMPAEGQNIAEHVAEKYGSTPGQSRAARERLSALGETLGFRFNYGEDSRIVNTFRAHQLLHWAGEQGCQTELKLELFESFFSRGEDISAAAVLVAAADTVGLSRAEAVEVLDDHRYEQIVREEQSIWLEREVHAVPTFVFNDEYVVPGAQEAETFVRVLSKVQSRAAT